MARRKTTDPKKREIEIVQTAYECALERIRQGKASDALLMQLLRQGSSTGVAQRERMIAQTELYRMQRSAIEDDARSSELFEEAISALQRYQGKRGAIDDEVI